MADKRTPRLREALAERGTMTSDEIRALLNTGNPSEYVRRVRAAGLRINVQRRQVRGEYGWRPLAVYTVEGE
jgi:ribonuclease I